ncbi:MAG: hypothetical protein WA584_11825 [Pyrinomonadaceae bacterium]
MKRNLFAIILSLFIFQVAMAQQPTPTPTTSPVKEANPADVSSIDAIMKAVYDVISGDAAQKRDWDRFRSLFHRDARLIPSGKNPRTGMTGARAYTAEQYITGSEPLMEKEGFFEKEIGRRTEIYGTMATIFSTYASYHKPDDKEPFERGINSFQLLFDGKRWWVMNIYWLGETKENPIPKQYLKTKKN